MTVLTVLQHGAVGSWDELAMFVMSALIGVALAIAIGSSKKSKKKEP